MAGPPQRGDLRRVRDNHDCHLTATARVMALTSIQPRDPYTALDFHPQRLRRNQRDLNRLD